MPEKAVHVVVHGKVQGVGFRYFVREKARNTGVNGWVKNLGDGSVEIVAEGRADLIDAFINDVQAGPLFGYIRNMDISPLVPTNSYNSFKIEY